MGAQARVYRASSLTQQDRLPVSTYDEAVRRLVQVRFDHSIPDAAYNLAVELVADIFWRNDKTVRRDVRVACRELGVS